MELSLKHKIHLFCVRHLNDKIQNLQNNLHELKEGIENDAKSSAGDKHETARSMMQLEQEKINRQLDQLQKQKNDLENINIEKTSATIKNGSLIKTNTIYLFLSVAIGKINVE